MENFQQLHRLTKLLYDHVQSYPEADEDRDSYISEIENKLNARAELLENYKGPIANLPKEKVDELVNWSNEINQHIAYYKEIVRKDALSLNQKQELAKKYSVPNRPISFDGRFYDQRN